MRHIIIALLLLVATVNAKNELLRLRENNTVMIKGPIMPTTVAHTVEELLTVDDDTVYVYFDTPGGSVIDGNDILDAFETLRLKGKKVVCVADTAISMGFVVFQHCPVRLIRPHAILMQHQMSLGLQGDLENIKSRMDFVEDMDEQLNSVQANRLNLTDAEFKSRTAHDWWMFGQTVLDNNAADRFAHIDCDFNPKLTNYTIEVMTFFGPVKIVFSKCPLMKSPLSIAFNVHESRNFTNGINEKMSKFVSFLDGTYKSTYLHGDPIDDPETFIHSIVNK
jgi:ATP-dependent protease ClpP protease subunit